MDASDVKNAQLARMLVAVIAAVGIFSFLIGVTVKPTTETEIFLYDWDGKICFVSFIAFWVVNTVFRKYLMSETGYKSWQQSQVKKQRIDKDNTKRNYIMLTYAICWGFFPLMMAAAIITSRNILPVAIVWAMAWYLSRNFLEKHKREMADRALRAAQQNAPAKAQSQLNEEAPAQPVPSGMQRSEALKILSLSEPVTLEDVKKAHRVLLQKVHPDLGGSLHTAQMANQARDVLMKELAAG